LRESFDAAELASYGAFEERGKSLAALTFQPFTYSETASLSAMAANFSMPVQFAIFG